MNPTESLMPIDNMIPPSAGAYKSLETLHIPLSIIQENNIQMLYSKKQKIIPIREGNLRTYVERNSM